MIRDYTKFTKLSNVANSTFGTTGKGGMSRPTSHKTTAEVIDENTIKISHTSILNFPSKSLLTRVMPKHRSDALSVINAMLAKMAEKYKKQYGEGVSLKVVGDTYVENVEYISSSMYSAQQRGFYRSHCIVKVS